jgi:hypothetical protein
VTTDLAQACSELGNWIAVAETLVAIPDQQPGVRVSSKPGSRAPWNPAVATALLDARQGIRDLECEMRTEVTGAPGRPRGGSDGNTRDALKAISAMEQAVSRDHVADALRQLISWANTIRRLPSIDDLPHWRRLRPGPDGMPPRCPFCETFSLRVAVESGVVGCWFPGCTDSEGRRPQARLEISRLNGSGVLVWNDGTVQ